MSSSLALGCSEQILYCRRGYSCMCMKEQNPLYRVHSLTVENLADSRGGAHLRVQNREESVVLFELLMQGSTKAL